jgi:hypothetical protein
MIGWAGSKFLACAVCFGAADPQITSAIHRAILFMVACTAVVLIGLTFMVVRTIKKTGRKPIAND